jgi:nucleotide-binding universal stress UspA family protein
MAFDTIWLATDLGREALGPYVHAMRIGVAAQASVTVLHVVDASPPAWDALPSAADLERAWSLAVGEPSRRALHGGTPGAFLGTVVEAEAPDLLVLGTHRPSGLRRWVRGSVSENVARRSLQTLIVPDGARPFVEADSGRVELDRILVPIGSSRAQVSVDAAVALRSLFRVDAELVLVHVGEVFPAVRIQPGVRARRILHAEGDVVGRVLESAVAQSVDLIVMATDGHDSLSDEIWGSRTERVVREAPVPVLSVGSGRPV